VSQLGWNPEYDPRWYQNDNELLDCFLCSGKVERRHALFFTQGPDFAGQNIAYPELAMHRACASGHDLTWIWLQWRNNLDDITKSGLPKHVLKSPFPFE
jgi:hypothetical protein